jgi:hypothetical protein
VPTDLDILMHTRRFFCTGCSDGHPERTGVGGRLLWKSSTTWKFTKCYLITQLLKRRARSSKELILLI